ncbi:MAG: DUF3102 domain-containing protein [Myxococcota bacterium]
MARPRKKRAKKTTRRSTPARRGSAVLVDSEPLEVRLTREILAVDGASKTRVVHDVVAIGNRLKQLQAHLGFGRWLSWLSEELPYSPRTAQRYIAVAAWAADNEEDFEAFAPLGLGKLQLLAALDPRQRARFRRQQRFQIPGTGTRKTLALMTREQLGAVIEGVGRLSAGPPAVDPTKILQRFRHRVAGLDALADQIREHADALERDEMEAALEALESVAEELRVALR